MHHIVEVNAEGALYLPPEVLEHVKPHQRFVVQCVSGLLVLRPEETALPFWATATPEERAADLRRWVASHTEGSGLSAEAVSRESMYE